MSDDTRAAVDCAKEHARRALELAVRLKRMLDEKDDECAALRAQLDELWPVATKARRIETLLPQQQQRARTPDPVRSMRSRVAAAAPLLKEYKTVLRVYDQLAFRGALQNKSDTEAANAVAVHCARHNIAVPHFRALQNLLVLHRQRSARVVAAGGDDDDDVTVD
jgi:hypothetical protein